MLSSISEQDTPSSKQQAQNFYSLLKSLEFLQYEGIQELYVKNVSLLKKNIKLLPTCPNLVEIQSIFKEVYNADKKSKTSTSPQYFFSKGKTLFIWLLSSYEFIAKFPPENLKNPDWCCISLFLPNSDPNALKCKWFRYIRQAYTHTKWTRSQDEAMLKIMKESYSFMFDISSQNLHGLKVKWAKISYELNKNTSLSQDFKKDSQCRERWFNHLNPYLNRNGWTLEEDIVLLEKALNNPKKWSKISIHFPGRNQHSVKNRFIYLINKEFNLKWQKTKEVIKREDLKILIRKTFDSLNEQQLRNSAETSKNLVNNEDSKENTVLCEESPLMKKDSENEEEDPCFFMDFKHLY